MYARGRGVVMRPHDICPQVTEDKRKSGKGQIILSTSMDYTI